ncbi:MAG: choice-of-anchor L domain-containing protein [Flavobacteriales bacterium]
MQKYQIFLFSFFLCGLSQAQIVPDQTGDYGDVEYLIKNVLIEPTVSAQMNVTNIKLNGVAVPAGTPTSNNEIGYFSNFSTTATPTAPALGFGSFGTGLFMATGGVDALNSTLPDGPNGTGGLGVDAHLTKQLEEVGFTTAAALNINNVTVIEFDFVAAGGNVSFDYTFASYEYPQFTCASVNDIFGFFISGPGIDGDTDGDGVPDLGYHTIGGIPYEVYNMAKVPDQTDPGSFTSYPVTINSINSGVNTGGPVTGCSDVNPNWVADSIYFVKNEPPGTITNFSYDGHTTSLTALANIQCGETYHMKLAIADVSDGILTSAVFLREGSFTIVSGETDQSSSFNQSDSILIEGCYPGEVIVQLSEVNPSAETQILVDVSGSAIEGVDFQDVIDTLFIPAGDSIGTITVTSIVDALTEFNESVIVTTSVCDAIISRDTFWIQDPIQISVEIPEDTTICANSTEIINISATPEGGYEPYSFQWFYGGVLEGVGPAIGIQPNLGGEHICVITGDCGYTFSDTFTVNYFEPTPTVKFTSFFNVETDQIVEGCEYGNLVFTLPEAYAVDTTLNFSVVGGNAISGVDFYELPTQITIPAGQLTGTVSMEAIVDGIFEGDETIQLYFPFVDACSEQQNPMTLTIISNPLLNSALEDSMYICQGETFLIEPATIGGIEAYVYNWTDNKGGKWTVENLELVGDTTTTYYLTIQDACEYEVKDSIVVVVPNYDPIEITSQFSDIITMCKSDDLLLEVEVEGGTGQYAYEWQREAIPISTEESLEIEHKDVAQSNYLLTVTDSCGNVGTKAFNIYVEHCEVPNIFTPNGDGLNDQFFFKSRDVETSIRVNIHDRWGNHVYHNDNYEICNLKGINCWDGININTEKESPEGVYFYTIEYNDGRVLKGSFHLMR